MPEGPPTLPRCVRKVSCRSKFDFRKRKPHDLDTWLSLPVSKQFRCQNQPTLLPLPASEMCFSRPKRCAWQKYVPLNRVPSIPPTNQAFKNKSPPPLHPIEPPRLCITVQRLRNRFSTAFERGAGRESITVFGRGASPSSLTLRKPAGSNRSAALSVLPRSEIARNSTPPSMSSQNFNGLWQRQFLRSLP